MQDLFFPADTCLVQSDVQLSRCTAYNSEEQHVLINHTTALSFPYAHSLQGTALQLARSMLAMTHSCISRAARGWAAHLPQSSVLPVVVGDGCFVLVLVRMAASPCRRRSAGHPSPAPATTGKQLPTIQRVSPSRQTQVVLPEMRWAMAL